MNIRDELLAEHSKRQTTKIVEYVGGDAGRFGELFALFAESEHLVAQTAAWAVSYCVEAHPHLIEPHFQQLLKILRSDDAPDAVTRNAVRLLQFVKIPRRFRGRFFDVCYCLMCDPTKAVAIRSFAMTVAADLANGEKRLLAELRLVATQHPQADTAGFRSRRRRVLGV